MRTIRKILSEKEKRNRLTEAVALFNARKWYECHEAFEDVWLGTIQPVRDVYKGLLQIGVAMYHWERGNMRGALRLFVRATDLLEPFLPQAGTLRFLEVYNTVKETVERIKTGEAPVPLAVRLQVVLV